MSSIREYIMKVNSPLVNALLIRKPTPLMIRNNAATLSLVNTLILRKSMPLMIRSKHYLEICRGKET